MLLETKRLLRSYRIAPKKRLGQSFLISRSIIRKLASHAEVREDDVVIDIGAGFGFLTEELARRAKKVLAIEIDAGLVRALQDRLGHLINVEIIHGDFLEVDIPAFDKVVSTPPYSIASPLLFHLLDHDFKMGVLAFQKEFATRLTAPPGTRDYGRLTVTTYQKAEVELLETIPRASFYPVPDVGSIIVKIKPRVAHSVLDEDLFSDLVRFSFTQRKRLMRKVLGMFLRRRGLNIQLDQILEPVLEKRVYHLSPEEFISLSNEICRKLKLT